MGPISEPSKASQWRATTKTGETQIFHLKLIAIDWAGTGGTVEAVNAACQKALHGVAKYHPMNENPGA